MGYQGSRKAQLQYLMQDADASLLHVIDDSALAQLLAVGGDVSDYDDTTDSLEAIANAISSIPCTAMRGTDNAFLASVGGALDDAAAVGAVTDSDTAMAYLKQLVTNILLIPTTVMRGTDSAALASVLGALDTAAASGAVSDAKAGMAYLKQLVTAIQLIPTTAMRGTDSAYLASVGATADEFNGHIPHFGGEIFYVNKDGDDANDGSTPHLAKLTIQAAIDSAVAGDAISIKAGTYVEDVVMSKASMELWCEIGAVLDGTGTCLTVSGGNCKVLGPVKITPAADQVGVHVLTNDGNEFEGVRVKGSASTAGWDFDIGGSILRNCSGGGIKSTGKCFDIGGDGTKLYDCYAAGTTTSYGFYADGTIVRGLLDGCVSIGNQTSGFYLDDVSGMTVKDCSSGAGDGRWKDIDSANVFSNFQYDNEVFKENVLSVTGAASSVYNLFRIRGAVKITALSGHVSASLTGTNTDAFLEIFSANGQEDISKDVDCDLGALGIGSVILKLDRFDRVLQFGDVSAGPAMIDQIDSKEEGFRLVEDHTGGAGVASYIRFNHTCAAGGTGTIHWHCIWEPVDDDGFVEAA